MDQSEFANQVLQLHYGVARNGMFKNRWLCPLADDFPNAELLLKQEKTRGHGLVEYSWDCPRHPEHSVRGIIFDTKSMKVKQR
ncbi:MAG: hypothetical protein U1E76_12145 [Planctomycetota bacterium]